MSLPCVSQLMTTSIHLICLHLDPLWLHFSLKCFHLSLLPGKQEANNNIGQLRSLVESDIAISGQFVFLVSALASGVYNKCTCIISVYIITQVILAFLIGARLQPIGGQMHN